MQSICVDSRKNVSCDFQIYIFEKKMALVYDVNISRLERIARCTGSSIFSYGDQFSDENLGKCDSFHLEALLENMGFCYGNFPWLISYKIATDQLQNGMP